MGASIKVYAAFKAIKKLFAAEYRRVILLRHSFVTGYWILDVPELRITSFLNINPQSSALTLLTF
jgi:uncharacterized protein YutE (UPF0331/DUF86 family)